MFDLLETFHVINGEVQHLSYHQERVNNALRDLYQIENGFSLADFFAKQDLPKEGTFRGRLLYEEEIKSFELIPYEEANIQTFTLVEVGEYEYPYKWADRSYFAEQKKFHTESDEVIFHQKGKIKDCTIANLAFLKEGIWYTPKDPMLAGTTRARYIREHKLQELDIFVEDIAQFERICLINVFRPLLIEKSLSLPHCIL